MKIVTEVRNCADAMRLFYPSTVENRVKYLTEREVNKIIAILEDGDSDTTMSIVGLNDFFAYEDDVYSEWLGYNSFDEIMNREED